MPGLWGQQHIKELKDNGWRPAKTKTPVTTIKAKTGACYLLSDSRRGCRVLIGKTQLLFTKPGKKIVIIVILRLAWKKYFKGSVKFFIIQDDYRQFSKKNYYNQVQFLLYSFMLSMLKKYLSNT